MENSPKKNQSSTNAANDAAGKIAPESAELQQARKKLESREKDQVLMVSANKIFRRGGDDMKSQLVALGMTEGEISKRLQPDFLNRTGFKDYELTNNSSEVRRLRARVASLEVKDHRARTEGNKTEEINGVMITQNYDADRVQLSFNGKPTEEVRVELKKKGFHWTPSQQVWQRKLTPQAVSEAHNVVKRGR